MNFHELGRSDTQTLLRPDTQITPYFERIQYTRSDTNNSNLLGFNVLSTQDLNIKHNRKNPTEHQYDDSTSQWMKIQQFGTQSSNLHGVNVTGTHGINMKQYGTQNRNLSFCEPGPRGIMNQYHMQNPNFQRFYEPGPRGMQMNRYSTQNPNYQRFNEPGSSGIDMNQYVTPNINFQGWKDSGSCGMNMNQYGTQNPNVQGFNQSGTRSMNHQSTEFQNLHEYNVPSSTALNMTQYNMPLYGEPGAQTSNRSNKYIRN